MEEDFGWVKAEELRHGERETDVVKLEEGTTSWFHRSTKNLVMKRRNIDLFLEMNKKCEFHIRAKTTTY